MIDAVVEEALEHLSEKFRRVRRPGSEELDVKLLGRKDDDGMLSCRQVGKVLQSFVVTRNRDLLVFVDGLALMTVAWFALRTVQ